MLIMGRLPERKRRKNECMHGGDKIGAMNDSCECTVILHFVVLYCGAFRKTQEDLYVQNPVTTGRHCYDTIAVRGERLLILCSADLPNVTKSCGKYWSGTDSTRSLLMTGSNVEGDE